MLDDRSTEKAVSTQSTIPLSGPMQVHLSVYRGDSGRFRITVMDIEGNPIDVSAATWDSDIRIKATDEETITSFTIVPVAEDTSSIDVILDATKSRLLTGSCVYDVEMTLNGEVSTLVYGNITVTQDVSRT